MISREDIEGLAALARLELSEAEIESLQRDISGILDYVGHVSTVSSVLQKTRAPLHHNVLREDTPRAAGDALAGKEAPLQKAFPRQEDGYNVVRKIIQKDE